jgi:hypothetical protein
MILFVTESERAAECAAMLQEATKHKIVIAESLARATALLRGEECQCVILDRCLVDHQDAETAALVEHLETAILLQVNLAISGRTRLLEEVRTALKRRRNEEERAREAARCRLRGELNDAVTAILLSTELALTAPDLPPAASEKMQTVRDLVIDLRRQLEGGVPTREAAASV